MKLGGYYVKGANHCRTFARGYGDTHDGPENEDHTAAVCGFYCGVAGQSGNYAAATSYCALGVCVCKTACTQTEGTGGTAGAYYMGYHVFPGTVLLAGSEDCYLHNYCSGCSCARMAHTRWAVRV